MLVKAIPVLHDYLSQLSVIDAHILHQQVVELNIILVACLLVVWRMW